MLRHIDRNESRALDLLRQIVNMDSASENTGGVNALGDLLAMELAGLGFEVEKVPSPAPYGNQIVGRLGEPPFETLLVGHMDTAMPEGAAASRPFRREGERCYGVGTVDMKGGIVCCIMGLESFLAAHPGAKGIAVLFNSDEEPGSLYSRDVLRNLTAVSKRALVLEPAQGAVNGVVLSRKGVGIFELAVSGIASHAGSAPEKGASAIHDLTHKALACLELANPQLETTINIGVVSGGTQPYVVAEEASIKMDFRVKTLEEAKRVEQGLAAIRDTCFVPRTVTELKGGFHRPPMVANEANTALFDEVKSWQVGLASSYGLAQGEEHQTET